MALAIFDRLKETTTTTGTGALTLGGALTGFNTFGSRLSDADTTYYGIEAVDASGIPTGDWEVGLGTVGGGGTTLTRTTVLASSNSDNAVNFTAGTKHVWGDMPAAVLTTLLLLNALSTGIVAKTGASSYAVRTITGTASRVTVANGSGVAGNPTLDIDAAYDALWQPIDADLTAFAALDATAGLLAKTAANTYARRTLTQPAAGITVSNGDGQAGNPTIALANDLAALEGLGSTGIAARTAADTWAQRTITGTSNRISVSNGDGAAGNPTLNIDAAYDALWQPVDADLSAVAGLSSNGLIARTGSGTAAVRTLTGTANELTVTNGDGVSGNPTFSIHADYGKGRWVQIASATASGSSTIDFTGFNLSLYEEYKIVFWGVKPAGNDFIAIRTSSNGGSSYDSGGTDYLSNYKELDGAYERQVLYNSDAAYITWQTMPATTDYPAYGEISIYSPQTAQYCEMDYKLTYFAVGLALQVTTVGSIWRLSNADVDGLRIFFSAQNVSVGEFRFHGRRK